MLASCAAPLSMPTLKYFESLNMKIIEIYGLTELTGPATSNSECKFCRIPHTQVQGNEHLIQMPDGLELLVFHCLESAMQYLTPIRYILLN